MSEDRIAHLQQQIEQQRKEHAAEQREMRQYFQQLNENMIHLTTAVTEWKTRDLMFEQRLDKAEVKLESASQRTHALEMKISQIEHAVQSNAKLKETIVGMFIKITTGLISLAIIGGLSYKFMT